MITTRNNVKKREFNLGKLDKKEAEKFRMYTNESFIKISNTFGSTTCPGIGPSWREIYNYKQYIKKQNKQAS